jgi:hypothetical protein
MITRIQDALAERGLVVGEVTTGKNAAGEIFYTVMHNGQVMTVFQGAKTDEAILELICVLVDSKATGDQPKE